MKLSLIEAIWAFCQYRTDRYRPDAYISNDYRDVGTHVRQARNSLIARSHESESATSLRFLTPTPRAASGPCDDKSSRNHHLQALTYVIVRILKAPRVSRKGCSEPPSANGRSTKSHDARRPRLDATLSARRSDESSRYGTKFRFPMSPRRMSVQFDPAFDRLGSHQTSLPSPHTRYAPGPEPRVLP